MEARPASVPAEEISESGLKRFWNAIKPPPRLQSRPEDAPTKESLEQKGLQRKLLLGTGSVLLVGYAGWEVYQYIASAPMRAEEAYQQGLRLVGAGDFEGAEKRFTRAVDIRASLAAGDYQRGLARKNLNQTDAAKMEIWRRRIRHSV